MPMTLKKFEVTPKLPERLAPLKKIAENYWYTWNWRAVRLFMRLDNELWEECYHNPLKMLASIPQKTLDEAAQDEGFLAAMDRVYQDMTRYLESQTWLEKKYPSCKDHVIAYFCAEYGITEALPNYSGGLGILAGDHMKSSSDLGITLVGVGLRYKHGYFSQRLNEEGWQTESYPVIDWFNTPLRLVKDSTGAPLKFALNFPNRKVHVQVWSVAIGR
ncbi:MAG: DUF3417 domain-containing protein, partial [Thermoplasmata archaeon]